MSHSVKVTLIADQEIELIGNTVNIHDLDVIHLDGKGAIVGYHLFPNKAARLKPEEKGRFVDGGKGVFKMRIK